ncbi:MAG: RNA-binding S4 domain-containing protein [Acetobacteraceae bacterium]|nr:RNA-binding S4 domain-containing protein [Acetobacteraceae bacterium]
MRLDKFLKVSRLVKRRTVADELCGAGRVRLNGRPAKSAARVKPGDTIELDLGMKRIKVEVLVLAEAVSAERAGELYRVLEEGPVPLE